MDSLFGIPMNGIMVTLVVLLGIALATVGVAALRNRVMFIVGVRSIPRRIAQTMLIVIGLMLSTLIISAAFTTGDTVDHSVTKSVYDGLGHVDEIIQFESANEGGGFGGGDVSIPMRVFDEVETALAGDPNVDGVAPVLAETVPAVNEETRLSVPNLTIVGADPARMAGFPDIIAGDGRQLDVAALADDEVYVNESAADDLSLQPGDSVTIYYRNEPVRFRVAEIVQDKAATGATNPEETTGIVAKLAVLQEKFDRPDNVDYIVVSNAGGVRDSVHLSDAVVEKIESVIEREKLDLAVEATKQDSLEFAELIGNGIMTFFLILGLFSIAAGVLLIIMIFVMLAAERKTEMGISRAVGTKRRHLIQAFMSEGMGYNVISAAVGVFLGILVSIALTSTMAAIFSEFDMSIEPSVTGRSLIISYSLGIVLTFITVVVASWRVSNLNIVRAIRDLPEPEIRKGISARTLGLCVAILLVGLLVGILTLMAPPLGMLAVVLFIVGMLLGRHSLTTGVGLTMSGVSFMLWGITSEQGFPYGLGFSLVFFGLAITLRYLRMPERPLLTTTGLILLAYWVLGAGGRLPDWFTAGRELEYGEEMFFLSGIIMVAAATFVLVYNADVLLRVLTFAGDRMGRILPAVKTAVAYPLASKFRTGMTLAMIALVVFALTMMSTMNANFERLFLSEESRGGWDIEVAENSNNPIGGLREALEKEGSVDVSQFRDVGTLQVPKPFATELRQEGEDDWGFYLVKGADDVFLANSGLKLQARATGYADDDAVWEAVRTQRNLAVIDANALPGNFMFGGELFALSGISYQDTEFDPITIEVRDKANGIKGEVTLIGILNSGASGAGPFSSFAGLITSDRFVREVFGEPDFSIYFARLVDPGKSQATAKAVEAALFTSGAQATSIKADREEEQQLFRGFRYLMQAFMGLGLVVGIAAVGVIAFRTVVERRQQIGMLRAIGYTRRTVALSFLMESSFVTLLGIFCGVGLAILLAYFLVTSDEFGATGITSFYVPWLELMLISLFAYLASLLMTFIPSRQAASIPIAEALRYE